MGLLLDAFFRFDHLFLFIESLRVQFVFLSFLSHDASSDRFEASIEKSALRMQLFEDAHAAPRPRKLLGIRDQLELVVHIENFKLCHSRHRSLLHIITLELNSIVDCRYAIELFDEHQRFMT